MTSYTRADWGSSLPRGGNVISSPVSEIYIHHFNSGIAPERTVAGAMARVRGAQAYHANTQGWGDIGYSWCVDDIGNDYEGRGWWRTGAHTYGYNSKGYAVCWLGDSNVATPSRAALEAIARVIQAGVAVGAVHPNPTIVAHRDRVPDTACCGDPMYAQLDQIRALAAGAPVPSGDDDLTPEQDALLKELAGTWRFDVYQMPDGRWLHVNAGTAAPAGGVLAIAGCLRGDAWAVEAATTVRVLQGQLGQLVAQVAAISQQVAQIKSVGGAAGASAADTAVEIGRRLVNG